MREKSNFATEPIILSISSVASVLNRGEAVNALKRAIYTGRVAGYQAKRDDEMQAVADALGLLATS